MKRQQVLFRIVIGVALAVQFLIGAGASSQTDPITDLMAQLSPEKKVAQLMMVTFDGPIVTPNSEIASLIRDLGVGGVVLHGEYNNLVPGNPVLTQALTVSLQNLAGTRGPFIPLLIAVEDVDEVSGMTNYANPMAVGATWDAQMARHVGEGIARELTALGINMYLGPDLSRQPPDNAAGPLTESFGEHPFWVGKLGSAFIQGLHAGGNLAVFPTHFPGTGTIARAADREIPVLPVSLARLRESELLPYLEAAREAEIEGVQCVNVRLQDETIQAITRPLCLDEGTLNRLLSEPELQSWRDSGGGLVISQPLGAEALREWYGDLAFPHRRAAREALMAGSDLLYIDKFGATIEADQIENVRDTIAFMAARYEEDVMFKMRVDDALRRVLSLKFELYESPFELRQVRVNASELEKLGGGDAVSLSVAREALSLIAPASPQLIPYPGANDTFVIFTDVRYRRACETCAASPLIEIQQVEDAMLRLYGPDAGGQVSERGIYSYSLNDLDAYLSGEQMVNMLGEMQKVIPQADWIVFVMLDRLDDAAHSDVMRRFLASENMPAGANVAALSFGAPLYLDATDISKLTAYYALYDTAPPFVDTAVRALFHESVPRGAPPVSIRAVGYDIDTATSPDPDQIIPIEISGSPPGDAVNPDVPTATSAVGDVIYVQAGPIYDRNGNLIPDGTPVNFTLTFTYQGAQLSQEAPATDGMAQARFSLLIPGEVVVSAQSGEAKTSQEARIRIAGQTQTITATRSPTLTFTPTWTPSVTDTPTRTPTITLTHTITYTPSQTPDYNATSMARIAQRLTWTARAWTATPTATITPSPTETQTPSLTPNIDKTIEADVERRLTLTASAWTPTPSPTLTYTPSRTSTPTGTATPTLRPPATPTPSPTHDYNATAIAIIAQRQTETATQWTPTPSPTATNPPTDTPDYNETAIYRIGYRLSRTAWAWTATPTPTATATPSLTLTPSFTPDYNATFNAEMEKNASLTATHWTNTPTVTNTPSPTPTPKPPPPVMRKRVTFTDLFASLLSVSIIAVIGLLVGRSRHNTMTAGLRAMLGSLVGGLLAYIYYGAGFPASTEINAAFQELSALIMSMIGAVTGLVAAVFTIPRDDGGSS